jgi:hypothetical protein
LRYGELFFLNLKNPLVGFANPFFVARWQKFVTRKKTLVVITHERREWGWRKVDQQWEHE